jgi:NADPH-dependent 7-cyano-7-deazaguanine reductase QueF-like protein
MPSHGRAPRWEEPLLDRYEGSSISSCMEASKINTHGLPQLGFVQMHINHHLSIAVLPLSIYTNTFPAHLQLHNREANKKTFRKEVGSKGKNNYST